MTLSDSSLRAGWLRLLVLTIATAAGVHAQTVSGCENAAAGPPGRIEGQITDPSSATVSGAVVILECGRSTLEAASGSDGRYEFRVPAGSYRLRVRETTEFAPVTASVSVTAGQTSVQDLRLQVSGGIESITVTAGGFEQLVRNAPASVTIVTSEQLQNRRVSDIAQAMIDVEGVDVGQDVGKTGGVTISMRGMPADYTLMLIDGRRQNAAGNVTPNGFNETATSFMPPVGAIERIEVVRGPMSTLYGSDAMGGVVNIITRKVSEKWTGSISVDGTLQGNTAYGDTGKGSVYLTGPVVADKLGVAFRGSAFRREAAALRYENLNGQQVPITSFGLSPTRSDIHNLGGRVTYSLNRNHEIYGDYDDMRQMYDNSANQLGTVGVQGGYAEKMRFRRNQALVSHVARFGFGQLDSSLTHNTTATGGRTIPPGTPGEVAGSARTIEATNTLLDSKLIAALGSRHTLSVGGQWWKANMVDGVAPNPYDFRQGALFAENEWRMLSRLTATLGVRYDNHNTFGGKMSPRAYLVYTPMRFLTIKGGVSRGYKTPQLNQLATGIVGFGGQGTIPLIGSPGLKPETSTSTEVGAALVFNPVTFNFTVFNNKFQNKIATGPGLENCSFRLSPDRPGCVDFGNWPNVDLFGQSINVDEAVTRGAEASMRLRFLRRWDIQNNYTFTHSMQQSGALRGQPLVNTPKHMYNATVRFNATEKLNTWVRIEARTSRTRGTSAAARAATEQIGPFKGYSMAHLGIGYQLSRSVMLSGTIYNLFDTNFLTYQPYVVNNVTNYASVYNNLQEPRRYWMSMTYNF